MLFLPYCLSKRSIPLSSFFCTLYFIINLNKHYSGSLINVWICRPLPLRFFSFFHCIGHLNELDFLPFLVGKNVFGIFFFSSTRTHCIYLRQISLSRSHYSSSQRCFFLFFPPAFPLGCRCSSDHPSYNIVF